MNRYVIVLLVMLIVASCSTQKKVAQEVVEKTIIETKYEKVIEIDTVQVFLPAQSAERQTTDSVSYLETNFAFSYARVNDGVLTHSLVNKDVPIDVPVEKTTERKDSIVYRDKEIKVPVVVEKELTKWQKHRLDSYGWLLIVAIVEALWIFRKPLYTVLRKIIGKKD